jgi:hypothetical protein
MTTLILSKTTRSYDSVKLGIEDSLQTLQIFLSENIGGRVV